MNRSYFFFLYIFIAGNRIRVRNCFSNPPSVHLRISGRWWSWIYRPLNKALKKNFRRMLAGSNGLVRHIIKSLYDEELSDFI